jgi:hypothetical protein
VKVACWARCKPCSYNITYHINISLRCLNLIKFGDIMRIKIEVIGGN